KALQAARTASTLIAKGDPTAGMNLDEYYEIPYTQFACISANIIDVTTGKILLGDGNNPFTSLIENDIIPELNLLLLKVDDKDGSQKLYAIDIATSTVVWSTKLDNANLAKKALKFAAQANGMTRLSINPFKPAATPNGDIIYNNNGKLSLINGKTGAITWENDCKPGTFFMNANQSKLITINKPTLVMNDPLGLGKKVMVIDPATGKNLWDKAMELEYGYKSHLFLNDNEILFAYQNGLNLYDLTTGKNLWKKAYKANNFKSMEVKAEGLEIIYGNKIIVIDPKTGKKVWKKEMKLDGIDENAKFDVYQKIYDKTRVLVTPGDIIVYDKTTGKKIWSKGFDEQARIGFDDKNSKILVISRKKIFVFNPDLQKKSPKSIDVRIENPTEVAGFDIKGDNYFIYGQREYLFIDKEGNLITQKEYKQLEGDLMKRSLLTATSIVSDIASAHGTVSVNGGPEQEVGVFFDPATAKDIEASAAAQDAMRKSLKANDKKRRAAKSDNNFAYFLQGDKSGEKNIISFVVVDKSTGKEVKTIEFSNNRDVVSEIDFNNGMLYYIDNNAFNIINLQ
ncbi:MAG TPA: PQQ-binding-like beta-propeller repeat protein, partial [Bacteroidales bacterium]|nr:PQQ-binding-like beta-propeller repeat protein [Bacteroidales bacterium]